MADRKSEAEIPALISDPIELAKKEAENALLQFDWAMEEVERWITAGRPNLRVSTLFALHRKAMEGIDPYAGNFRPASVAIRGSSHDPVAGDDVARYVEEMLDYINNNWSEKLAIHLSAYVMWRLNWIHPFADGNGRTSRILSYMILCGKLEKVLPGSRTIPEQISENKQPYYDALEKADKEFKQGATNVQAMELLLEGYLANQLIEIQELATGNSYSQEADAAESGASEKSGLGLIRTVEAHPVIVSAIVAVALGILAFFT